VLGITQLDPQYLVSISDDHTVRVFRKESGVVTHTMNHSRPKNVVIRLFDFPRTELFPCLVYGANEEMLSLVSIKDPISSTSTSTSASYTTSSGATSTRDRNKRRRKVETTDDEESNVVLIQQLPNVASDYKTTLCELLNGDLACVEGSNTIVIFDMSQSPIETRLAIRRSHEDTVSCLLQLSDGKTLASGSFDQSVKFWNIFTGQCLKTFDSLHSSPVYSIAQFLNGAIVTSAGETVVVWEHPYRRPPDTFFMDDEVYCVAARFDGTVVASVGSEGTTLALECFMGTHISAAHLGIYYP